MQLVEPSVAAVITGNVCVNNNTAVTLPLIINADKMIARIAYFTLLFTVLNRIAICGMRGLATLWGLAT